jgi:hypothetical protein
MMPSPRTGDRHPPALGHEPTEFNGGRIVRVIRRRASRTKDRDLVWLRILPEHTIRVPHLLHRRRDELELTAIAAVGDELKRGRHELVHHACLVGAGLAGLARDLLDQPRDGRRNLRVVGAAGGARLGRRGRSGTAGSFINGLRRGRGIELDAVGFWMFCWGHEVEVLEGWADGD